MKREVSFVILEYLQDNMPLLFIEFLSVAFNSLKPNYP